MMWKTSVTLLFLLLLDLSTNNLPLGHFQGKLKLKRVKQKQLSLETCQPILISE